jgi:hypothetical protein
LLARLALTPGVVHRREVLAGALWPDTRESQARSNLRHALWRVRSALKRAGCNGACIRADGIGMSFDEKVEAWVDAREFASLCQIRPLTPRGMMKAAQLYAGALLPGFYDDWSLAQRDRLQLAYDALMSQLVTRLREERRWIEVQQLGSMWASISDSEGIPELAVGAVQLAMRELMNADAVAPATPGTIHAVVRHTVEQLKKLLDKEDDRRLTAWPRGGGWGLAPSGWQM